jgi:hypothetical protein
MRHTTCCSFAIRDGARSSSTGFHPRWGGVSFCVSRNCGDVLRERLCVDAACVYAFDAMWDSCFVTSCCTSFFFCRSSPFRFFVDEHLRTICDLKPKKKECVGTSFFLGANDNAQRRLLLYLCIPSSPRRGAVSLSHVVNMN